MPASSVYGFSPSLSNQKPVGIKTVYVKESAGYSPLGFIRNGKINISSIGSEDTYGREFGHAVKCEYSFEMMQASSTEVALLDELTNGAQEFIIVGVDGQQYEHLSTDSLVIGVSAAVVSDSAIDKNKFIEIKMQGAYPASKLHGANAIIKSSPTSVTRATSGVFYGIVGTDTATTLGRIAGIVPSGFSTVSIGAWSEASGTVETVGRIKNGRFRIEQLSELDDSLRINPYCVNVDLSFDMLESHDAMFADLELMFANGNHYIITGIDTSTVTIDSSTARAGFNWKLNNEGNIDKIRTITVSGKGKLASLTISGFFS
jgi:hypothetical protein